MDKNDEKNVKYEPTKIEPKWQKKWEEEDFYIAEDGSIKEPNSAKAASFAEVATKAESSGKEKFYLLIEFPYPSGAGLHVGHVRSWSAMDAYARKKRMEGFNVLYPIGWDAFGLPAENYAIKNKIHPSVAVKENIANFKRQIKSLGISFDWSREVDTTDPKYYKWTQWIFLKFFEKGLAYQDNVTVNWCPFCKTNLADEEVLADGKHERCQTITEKRQQKQWLLKITAYADRLIDDLKLVDYSQKIAVQQVNWIGRSEGVQIEFKIQNSKFKIEVFTTALDTIFGTTFMVIAPELAKKYISEIPDSFKESVLKYLESSFEKSEVERQSEKKEKTGVETGLKAINPFNGQEIQIFVADYVLSSYGTGAVMGVPGHDARDHEFAKKYKLPIIPVIKPANEIKNRVEIESDGFWNYLEIKENSDKAVLFNSGNFSGLSSKEAKAKLQEELVKMGIGKKTIHYHLRDWVFSRQHYWGEPIPIIFCSHCAKNKISNIKYQISNKDGIEYAVIPVPEDQLPVELPYLEKYEPSGTGESPLATVKDWVNVQCPVCGSAARRETDTMPNWAGSNWYFLRYLDPKNDKEIASKEKMAYWMPVDLYQGGFEHTTLHVLYSRFVYKFLYDIKAVPTAEPYAKRRSHGIVLGSDGRKMSKSFGNVINPDDIVGKFGADTLRIYEMFMGPFDQTIAWSEEGVEGCFKFLKRVWKLSLTKVQGDGYSSRESSEAGDLRSLKSNSSRFARTIKNPEKTSSQLIQSLNKTIKKVGSDLDNLKFNTAVAAMMEFINVWQADEKGLNVSDLKTFLLILTPFAPHLTEEVYQNVILIKAKPEKDLDSSSLTQNDKKWKSINQESWPGYDPKLLEENEVTIVVMVNGKMRDTIIVQSAKINPDLIGIKDQSYVEEMAKGNEKVKKHLEGKSVKKVIYISGKVINFVL